MADIEARLDEGERSAELLPHRRKYLLMTIDSLPRYLERVDRVERELTPGTAEPGRNQRRRPGTR
jgi:hypothetical protein